MEKITNLNWNQTIRKQIRQIHRAAHEQTAQMDATLAYLEEISLELEWYQMIKERTPDTYERILRVMLADYYAKLCLKQAKCESENIREKIDEIDELHSFDQFFLACEDNPERLLNMQMAVYDYDDLELRHDNYTKWKIHQSILKHGDMKHFLTLCPQYILEILPLEPLNLSTILFEFSLDLDPTDSHLSVQLDTLLKKFKIDFEAEYQQLFLEMFTIYCNQDQDLSLQSHDICSSTYHGTNWTTNHTITEIYHRFEVDTEFRFDIVKSYLRIRMTKKSEIPVDSTFIRKPKKNFD